MTFRSLLLAILLPSLLWAAEQQPQPGRLPQLSKVSTTTQGTTNLLRTNGLALSAKYTNALTLAPKEEYGVIARTFARMLERSHYTRHPFNDEISGKFFDRYLELLDPQRVYFLQPDFDEFFPLRQRLDEVTMRLGNTSPAYDIFNRFLQRFDQQYLFVMDYLQTNSFTFNTDEKFQLDRKNANRPKDPEAAQQLWRDRVRSEYLSEKLTVGDRSELLGRFRTNVSGARWDQLTRYLTNKFSVEKATELTQFARLTYDQSKTELGRKAKPQAIVNAVMNKVEKRLEADTHDEIVKKLTRRYNRVLRNLKQYEPDEVLQLWLNALGHAYDPHTDYFGKRELESFSINMNLSLFGIGATLQSEDGYTVVRTLVAGAPADVSKQVKVNDRIIAVAQGDGDFVDVQDEKLSKVVDQIRGPKGSKVRLQIIPAGADLSVRKVVSLIRDEVKLEDSEAKAKLVELSLDGRTNRIGVIDLPSFYANFPVAGRRGSGKTTTGDVSKLLKKLLAEGAEGIVLDLRRNGGGSLEESINLTGLFIKSGPVVQVRNFDGRVNVDESPEESAAYEGPLVVLTSRFSASASEILAGALQDHDRALIVGDKSTHGKGTVQTVQELGMYLSDIKDAGAAKVTIRKFYRPSGASTQLKGVVPDIILPSVENFMEVGEAAQENALAWDTIEPSRFQKDGSISKLVSDLNRRSTDRVASDRDFDYIREDSERYRKAQADKTVSLNESARRAEIAENKTRIEARKKEQASRKGPQPTTWEITLKNADQAGLPSPMTNSPAITAHSAVGATSEKESASKPSVEAGDGSYGDPDGEEEDAKTPPPIDPHMKEAQRILIDLLRHSSSKGVTAGKN